MINFLIAVDKPVRAGNRTAMMLFRIRESTITVITSRIIEPTATLQEWGFAVGETIKELQKTHRFTMDEVAMVSDIPVIIKDREVTNKIKFY